MGGSQGTQRKRGEQANPPHHRAPLTVSEKAQILCVTSNIEVIRGWRLGPTLEPFVEGPEGQLLDKEFFSAQKKKHTGRSVVSCVLGVSHRTAKRHRAYICVLLSERDVWAGASRSPRGRLLICCSRSAAVTAQDRPSPG